MTLEEKIAHLQTTSMEQARLEGNVIIDTHQAALEKVFEDHKAEATRQSETRIKAEAANAKLSLNQALLDPGPLLAVTSEQTSLHGRC